MFRSKFGLIIWAVDKKIKYTSFYLSEYVFNVSKQNHSKESFFLVSAFITYKHFVLIENIILIKILMMVDFNLVFNTWILNPPLTNIYCEKQEKIIL